MKINIGYNEIINIIHERYSVRLKFKTIDSKTMSIGYKPNRLMPMSIDLHIEAMRKDVICLSYDCLPAISLIISGVVSFIENHIPSGIEVDVNDKRINIYPERFDKIKKGLEYFSLTEISFSEDTVDVSLATNFQ